MSRIRLYDVATCDVSSFDLSSLPPYVAVSHVWSESLFFPNQQRLERTPTLPGMRAVRAVLTELHPDVRHVWVDTLCIDQSSEAEKLEQIPLMKRIYSDARCTAVVLRGPLGEECTQARADELEAYFRAQCLDVVERNLDSDAEQEFWHTGDRPGMLGALLQILGGPICSEWCRRVWTMQEFVLARKIVWVGSESRPVVLSEFLYNEALTKLYLFDFIRFKDSGYPREAAQRMVSVGSCRKVGEASSKDDLLYLFTIMMDADTTLPVDRVYGIMGAIGVEIVPIAGENLAGAWRRWWEKAVGMGRLSLLMTESTWLWEEEENCVMPELEKRQGGPIMATYGTSPPYGQVKVSGGTVCAFARSVGTCRIVENLFDFSHAIPGSDKMDGYVVLLCRGNARIARHVANAIANSIGGTNICDTDIEIFAELLLANYEIVESLNRENNLANFTLEAVGEAQARLLGLFRGTTHWSTLPAVVGGRICIGTVDTPQWGTTLDILVSASERLPQGRLRVLDFNAVCFDKERIVILAEEAASDRRTGSTKEPGQVLHKFGTARLALHPESRWEELPLGQVRIGGSSCPVCGDAKTK